MGKLKNRNGSETEHLRGLIKSLKSENKNLKKRLRQLEKKEHIFDYQDDFEEIEEYQDKSICGHCGKGELKYVDLGRAVYEVCPICDNRKKV